MALKITLPRAVPLATYPLSSSKRCRVLRTLEGEEYSRCTSSTSSRYRLQALLWVVSMSVSLQLLSRRRSGITVTSLIRRSHS